MDFLQAPNDILNAVENAIDVVVDKIIDVMKNEIDNQGIGKGENVVYNPTGEFRESWVAMTKRRLGLVVDGGMTYEPNLMSLDAENFVHGSKIYDPNDARPFLDDIIFDGNSSDLWGGGWWTAPRDAWSEMEKYVDANIDKWFDDAMAIQGYPKGAKLL